MVVVPGKYYPCTHWVQADTCGIFLLKTGKGLPLTKGLFSDEYPPHSDSQIKDEQTIPDG